MRKDRQAKRQTERQRHNEAFRNFANAPKTNSSVIMVTHTSDKQAVV